MSPYSGGSQAVISNTEFGVVKWLMDGPRMTPASYLDLDRRRFDFNWNVAALANGEVVVTNIRENAIYLIRDSRPDCPQCELVISRVIEVPRSIVELTIHFSVSYDGHILILMEDHYCPVDRVVPDAKRLI